MKAEQLQRLRKRLGWTQEELAREVGVARNSVARWERGEMAIGEPAARLIQRIADDRKVKR
ncbi:helix-turn-helix transcriptional regulator [Candidatus Binatus sp.]|jgi:transcriptional regulator with XRE-family HTH domain|uniref:helix-turn-helix transcriptional regulator n=1 Tax=Candidatus Binatus sp. TaxID=2811406 RepID=UPI003CC58445